jgi:hypothetical protein
MMIDFPAPVSPVIAINPGLICHSSSSTSARFLIRSSVRTAGIFEDGSQQCDGNDEERALDSNS